MKTVIHVNQHVIKANAKTGADEPPLTVKDYRQNRRAYTAEILDGQGNVVARIVNRPHDPLSCGARVWIETTNEVRVVTSRDEQGEISDDVEPGAGKLIFIAADRVEEGDVLHLGDDRHVVAGRLTYDDDSDPVIPLQSSLRRWWPGSETTEVAVTRT